MNYIHTNLYLRHNTELQSMKQILSKMCFVEFYEINLIRALSTPHLAPLGTRPGSCVASPKSKITEWHVSLALKA